MRNRLQGTPKKAGSFEPAGGVLPFRLPVRWPGLRAIVVAAALLVGGVAAAAAQTYPSGAINLAIPDHGAVAPTISVPDTGALLDVNVQLSFSHTFFGDLTASITSPTGTTVSLFTGSGSADPNGSYTFDDAASALLTGADISGGTFKSSALLSGLNGEAANGTWTLHVADGSSGDTGTLFSWSVILTVPSNPSFTAVKSSPDTAYANVGDVLHYQILVTNTGGVALTALTIDDAITSDETCPVTSLAPLNATTCTATHTVTLADLEAGFIDNTATIDTAETPAQSTNTVTIGFDPSYVRVRTERIISNFLSRRADLIAASEPDLAERLSLAGAAGGSGPPLAFAANGTPEHFGLDFATSLSQLADADAGAKQAALDHVMAFGEKPSAGDSQRATAIQAGGQPGDPRPGLDAWIKGQWAHVDDETRKSDLGLLHVGADYLINPSLLVGALAQVDWMVEKDSSAGAAADGLGWMAGPYLVARLDKTLLFDARVGWGQSNNHVDPLGLYSDGFKTDRWLARGQLTGDFRDGNWRFSPEVSAIYFEENQKAYTDSLGVAIPGQTISLGRLMFGPNVSYAFQGNGFEFEPHVGIQGIWDFDKAEIVDLGSGLAAGSSAALRARFEAGLSFRLANGASLTGEGFYDGIGASDLSIYGGSMKLSVPLN